MTVHPTSQLKSAPLSPFNIWGRIFQRQHGLQPYLLQAEHDLVLEHRNLPAALDVPTRRVLVIGGGVTGLTTTWALLDAGFEVVIVSESWAPALPRITSQIAGALCVLHFFVGLFRIPDQILHRWEFPPAVCGAHTNTASLANSKRWAMMSYHIFSQLSAAANPLDHGIRMLLANFFFTGKIEDLPDQLSKMHEIAGAGVQAFRRDPHLIIEHVVNEDAGLVDAYQHLAPVIDTDAYMIWLRNLVVEKGAKLQTGRISGDLLNIEKELLAAYGACAIVNATGLQAKELAGDNSVFPLRGGLIRVVNDGTRFPRITEALCVSHDDSKPEDDDFVFILPRNDNVLLLGGLAQAGVWDLDLTISSPKIQRIRSRCNDFIPGLENAQLDPETPFVQGLRPLTRTNVRVDRESRARKGGRITSKIVHSYGHGGSGFSLSFGCAADVLAIVRQIVKEEQPVETGMIAKL